MEATLKKVVKYALYLGVVAVGSTLVLLGIKDTEAGKVSTDGFFVPKAFADAPGGGGGGGDDGADTDSNGDSDSGGDSDGDAGDG